MNILLWVLQILLALHTLSGAFWKFSNPSETVPSLQAIPGGGWLVLSIIELLCVVGLILPGFVKSLGNLAPVAATIIAAEMVLFIIIHLVSQAQNTNEIIYWLVVAVFSAFIAYGRFFLVPLKMV